MPSAPSSSHLPPNASADAFHEALVRWMQDGGTERLVRGTSTDAAPNAAQVLDALFALSTRTTPEEQPWQDRLDDLHVSPYWCRQLLASYPVAATCVDDGHRDLPEAVAQWLIAPTTGTVMREHPRADDVDALLQALDSPTVWKTWLAQNLRQESRRDVELLDWYDKHPMVQTDPDMAAAMADRVFFKMTQLDSDSAAWEWRSLGTFLVNLERAHPGVFAQAERRTPGELARMTAWLEQERDVATHVTGWNLSAAQRRAVLALFQHAGLQNTGEGHDGPTMEPERATKPRF